MGVFPDPYNCTKYYICVEGESGKLVSYAYSCSGNWGYNMLSTYCDIPLEYGSCPKELLTPPCKELASTGSLEKNKSIWYICVLGKDNILVHDLHLCPNGHMYDGMMCKPQ